MTDRPSPNVGLREAIVGKLKWVIVGAGPQPRDITEQRMLVDWIDRAVQRALDDAESFEATMLYALWHGTFTFTVEQGEVKFQLTDKGRSEAETALMNRPALRWLSSLAKEPERPQ